MTDVQDQVRELERTAVVATTNGPVRAIATAASTSSRACATPPRPWARCASSRPDGPRPGPRSPMRSRSARRRSRSASRPATPPAAAAPAIRPRLASPAPTRTACSSTSGRQGLTGKRPVMVWLHGGGFANGSGGAAMYDGGNLARRGDVVIVTVNHRLNVFGYLHLGELGGDPSSGQAGMLDIVARARVGARQHRGVRRRPGQRHHLRRERRRGEGLACCRRCLRAHGPLPPRHRAERPGAARSVARTATANAKALLDVARRQAGRAWQSCETLSAAEIQDAAAKVAGRNGRSAASAPASTAIALPRDPFDPGRAGDLRQRSGDDRHQQGRDHPLPARRPEVRRVHRGRPGPAREGRPLGDKADAPSWRRCASSSPTIRPPS